MKEKKVDISKPIQTRDGRKVVILGPSESLKNVLTIVIQGVGTWYFSAVWDETYNYRQTKYQTSPGDIVNVSERKTVTRFVTAFGESFSTWSMCSHTIPVLGELDFITEDDELVDVVFRKATK